MNESSQRTTSSPWGYFALAYGISWALWGIAWLIVRNDPPVTGSAEDLIAAAPPAMLALVLAGVWGPFLSAFILTWKAQGKAGVAELWKSGWRWRIGWTWFAVALLIYPVFKLAALLISGAGVSFQPFTVPLMLLGMAIFHWFLGGPFGEEFGWRGYALPRLLDRFGAVTASLVIGVFWIGWHLPLFIIPGSPQAQLPFWPWAAGVIAMAIIMTWVHRHVGGVVFAAILLHFSANWSNDLIQPATEVGSGWDQPDGIGLILAIVFAAALIPLLSTARRHAQDAQNR